MYINVSYRNRFNSEQFTGLPKEKRFCLFWDLGIGPNIDLMIYLTIYGDLKAISCSTMSYCEWIIRSCVLKKVALYVLP